MTRFPHNVLSKIQHCNFNDESSFNTFEQHVLTYVKEEAPDIGQYKLKILESIGGQTHVRCTCNQSSFIPTNAVKGNKKNCYKCDQTEPFVC